MECYKDLANLSTDGETANFLLQLGNQLASTCPAASRYYMFNLERRLIGDPKVSQDGKRHTFCCNRCGSIRSPGNYKVQVQRRPSLNNHLKNLFQLEMKQPWRLNMKQKKKLRRFRNATSKIVCTCLICKRKMIFLGTKKSNVKVRPTVELQKPLPKFKSKKSDLNSGLCISSTNIENPSTMLSQDTVPTALQKSEPSKFFYTDVEKKPHFNTLKNNQKAFDVPSKPKNTRYGDKRIPFLTEVLKNKQDKNIQKQKESMMLSFHEDISGQNPTPTALQKSESSNTTDAKKKFSFNNKMQSMKTNPCTPCIPSNSKNASYREKRTDLSKISQNEKKHKNTKKKSKLSSFLASL